MIVFRGHCFNEMIRAVIIKELIIPLSKEISDFFIFNCQTSICEAVNRGESPAGGSPFRVLRTGGTVCFGDGLI